MTDSCNQLFNSIRPGGGTHDLIRGERLTVKLEPIKHPFNDSTSEGTVVEVEVRLRKIARDTSSVDSNWLDTQSINNRANLAIID